MAKYYDHIKILIKALLVILICFIISQKVRYLYANNVMLIAPLVLINNLDTGNKRYDYTTLLIINIIYFLFNPVNVILQLLIIIVTIILYRYIINVEITETATANLTAYIVIIASFVVAYFFCATLINNQEFVLNNIAITRILLNIFVNLGLFYLGKTKYFVYKKSKRLTFE